MRILVTGVSGQAGGALLPPLKGLGSSFRTMNSHSISRKADAIPGALERDAPDLIINPAAYTAVDKAEDERDLAMRINVEAPGIIARWAAAHAVPLIHYSTDYVHDGSGGALGAKMTRRTRFPFMGRPSSPARKRFAWLAALF